MSDQQSVPADNSQTGSFFSLTPERVLDAVEQQAGQATTGLCYALNSLENRVYEVELEDRTRLVGKFYRPGRWSRDTILDEHRLLAALAEAEIPVCAPLPFDDGETLRQTPEGIHFALFPRMGGRAIEDLNQEGYTQLGRLIGRIHAVAAGLDLRHRPLLSPQTYGADCLQLILDRCPLSPSARARYQDVVEQLIAIGERRFAGVDTFVIHADCHRGNLLARPDGWLFLDFDDSARGPAVQDFWLLLPARVADCPVETEALLEGYRQFAAFEESDLGLIEVLRGLRYVRYAAWVAARWDDPAFKRAFSDWGSERYWESQVSDLHEQLAQLCE